MGRARCGEERAALDAAGDTEIPDRDMYTLFDGGRPGMKTQLLAGFATQDGTLLLPPVISVARAMIQAWYTQDGAQRPTLPDAETWR